LAETVGTNDIKTPLKLACYFVAKKNVLR
jgi:hypothetical protein